MPNTNTNRDEVRETAASIIAARKMGLAQGDNYLRGRDVDKFRRFYTEAYMAQHSDPVEIEPACSCPYRPFNHVHTAEYKAREKRIFEWHLKQGRTEV